jgi:PAS domain S-box-containing protein
MDGIIANDRKGNIIIFNEGASRIYGYTQEEALSNLHVTQLYPEGEAREIKKKIYDPEYGGSGHLINCEVQALTKDGRLTPILLSATLIYEEGVEVATVGYFKDLTEIKCLQDELLQSTKMIAINQAVQDMAERAENILYGMKLGASIVEKEVEKKESGQLRKGWGLLSKSLDQISQLTLDMQSYVYKESDHQDFVSLNDLVNKVCAQVDTPAQERGIRVERDLMEDLPDVLIDAQKIYTCLLHLINNALESFTEESTGGLVTVRTSVAPDNQICLEVVDTGRGIDQQLQKEIFNPFFTTKRAEGTGLGLAVTKKIIREHQGSIRIQSQPNQGSTFTILLPLGRK